MTANPMMWRRCMRFPLYEVSECGDVRRGERRPKGFIDADGYIRYVLELEDGGRGVVPAHQLVAEAFIGNAPSELHEVAHDNGSRIFNHFTNLRWATRVENDADRQVHGTAPKGIKNGNAKLSDDDVRDIRRQYFLIKNRLSCGKISDLAEVYGIHHATLIRVATGKSWPHLSTENAQ